MTKLSGQREFEEWSRLNLERTGGRKAMPDGGQVEHLTDLPPEQQRALGLEPQRKPPLTPGGWWRLPAPEPETDDQV